MAHSFFNPFRVIVTALIALVLLAFLLPLMLTEWGPVGSIPGSFLLLFALFLAYVRGYWISRWLTRRHDRKSH